MTGDQNLAGLSAAEAKEYIFGFIATLKLTEKEIQSLQDEAAKWKARADMARSRGISDLLAEAEKEAEKASARIGTLEQERSTLQAQVDSMRRQLPGLAARERSVDPDLLEQELLVALGRTAEEAAAEKAFQELEKEDSAEAALQVLKAKMNARTNEDSP